MDQTSAKKHINWVTKLLLFVFLLLIGYVIVAQTILIPRAISNQYTKKLNPSLAQLKTKFNAISKSTEADVYNDPYADPVAGRKQLLESKRLIAETNQALDAYDEQAKQLPKSLFSFDTESYKKAKVTRDVTADIFAQSKTIMNEYDKLTDYLLAVNSGRTVFKNNTADINSLINLGQLAGKGPVIAKRADQVGDMIQSMQPVKAPAGFDAYQATLVNSFKQGETGLQQLSKGVTAADDGQVNASIKVIEQAVTTLESDSAQQFSKASSNSVAIKDAGTLADKIDSLQPFAEQ